MKKIFACLLLIFTTTIAIQAQNYVRCTTCNGTGSVYSQWNGTFEKCYVCSGKGRIQTIPATYFMTGQPYIIEGETVSTSYETSEKVNQGTSSTNRSTNNQKQKCQWCNGKGFKTKSYSASSFKIDDRRWCDKCQETTIPHTHHKCLDCNGTGWK